MKIKTIKNNQEDNNLKKDKVNNLAFSRPRLLPNSRRQIFLSQKEVPSKKEVSYSSAVISSPGKAERRSQKLINLKALGRWTAVLLVILFLAVNCQKKASSSSSDLPPSSQSESRVEGSPSSLSHQHQEKAMVSGEKVKIKKEEKTLYHCPMHPNYIADKPGECPICGMTLVPIEAEKGKVEEKTALPLGTVEISLEKQQLLGVTFGQVERRELHHLISAYGRFTYDETRLASITTKFSGWIEKLFVNFTGKLVKRGEPLFSIYSPELIAAQEEYLLALRAQKTFSPLNRELNLPKEKEEKKQIDQSQSKKEKKIDPANPFNLDENELLARYPQGDLNQNWSTLIEASRRRLLLWDISQEQIERIEKEAKPFRNLTIYSPATGFIIEKNVVEGQFVMAGEKLFSLADLSRLWLLADIYEQDLSFIHLGQEVDVESASFSNGNLRGRISYIYPYLERESRTVKVRIEFPNSGYKLKPELYGRLKIHLMLGERLSIPEDAVIDTGERRIVFVVHEGRHFEPREVKLGLKAGDYYEVLSGLEEGDQIVTSAQFLIDSESRLKVAMQGLHAHPQEKQTQKKEEKTPPPPAKHIH